MIASPCLEGRDRYERVMEGWVDSAPAGAFTHTVRITDDDFAVEVRAVCTPPPGYEVREAAARVLGGGADPAIARTFQDLRGARMVGGFTKRLTDVTGPRVGAGLFVDAGIEVARLARQVTRLPAAAVADLCPGDARRCWELDTTGWADLPDSCFTYTQAGRALFDAREVTTPMAAQLYSPPPGAVKIFQRKKLSRLVRTGRRLDLFHSMHDNVHGFDLHYEIDLGAGTIVAADAVVSRLPYRGICDEPQGKIASMIGQPVDGLLRKRTQTVLGGAAGCAQLYDLTADLLKLLTF